MYSSQSSINAVTVFHSFNSIGIDLDQAKRILVEVALSKMVLWCSKVKLKAPLEKTA